MSILGQLAMVRYGVNMHARAAPNADAKRWRSFQDVRDDHLENNVKAKTAHAIPKAIATQNGCTGLGTNNCVMSANQAAPITSAVSPATHAGIALCSFSGAWAPTPRTR